MSIKDSIIFKSVINKVKTLLYVNEYQKLRNIRSFSDHQNELGLIAKKFIHHTIT